MEINGILRRGDCSILQKKRYRAISGMAGTGKRGDIAIGQSQRFVGSKWVLIGGQWRQLIELAADGQVGSLTTHICQIGDDVSRQFSLKAEAPLLSIRPRGSCWNRRNVQWIR